MFILDVCAGMPDVIVNIINKIVNIIKIIAPIGIVVFGMIDFVKAVSSQKDDEISKGQKVFIKRLLTGVLTFFVIAFVQLVLGIVDSNGTSEAMSCLNAILGGGGGTTYKPSNVTTANNTPCSSRGLDSCISDGACELCGQTGSSVPACVEKEKCVNGTTAKKTTTTTTTKKSEYCESGCYDMPDSSSCNNCTNCIWKNASCIYKFDDPNAKDVLPTGKTCLDIKYESQCTQINGCYWNSRENYCTNFNNPNCAVIKDEGDCNNINKCKWDNGVCKA